MRRARPAMATAPAALIALTLLLAIAGQFRGSAAALVGLAALNGVIIAMGLERTSRMTPGLGWLHPGAVVFTFLGFTYVLRPLFLAWSGVVGTPTIGYRPLGETSVVAGLAVMSAALMCFTCGFHASGVKLWRRANLPEGGLRSTPRARLVLVAALSISAMVPITTTLADHPAGIFSALTVRHVVLRGMSAYLYIAVAYKLALLVTFAVAIQNGRHLKHWTLLAFWLPATAIDLATGERAELILGNLLPFGALLLLARRKEQHRGIPLRRALLIALPALLFFVSYRVVVRDVGEGFALADAAQGLATLPSFLMDSGEVAGLDYYVRARDSVPTLIEHRPVAEAAQAIAMAPLPSGVVSKPPRSAELLTSTVAPERHAAGANITFTAAGDLHLVFGDVGVIIGYGVLGLLAGWMIRGPLADGFSFLGLALSFHLAWLVVPILRSDLYPLGTLPVNLLITAAVCRFLLRRSAHGMRSSVGVPSAMRSVAASRGLTLHAGLPIGPSTGRSAKTTGWTT